MDDYLEVIEKFKDVKDISNYIDEVQILRYYFRTRQYQNMQDHIATLMTKYIVETVAWNTVNKQVPTTYEQAYVNAENFMQMQGAKLVVEKVADYQSHLTAEEITFIQSMIKLLPTDNPRQ